jgi:hypothetical protein
MAGKMCDGTIEVPSNPILSRAYCEGRNVATNGGALTDNPHDGDGTPEETAWDTGFNSYNGGVGTALAQDCCADPAYDGVP